MKTLILLSLFVLFLAGIQLAGAQTVDEVIENMEKARGGKEKLLGISSIYMEGSREMMGNEVSVKITKVQDKLSRTEFEMGGSNGFNLVTDKEAWNYFPMRMDAPRKMPDEVLPGLQTELDIAGPLVNYAAKGHVAELLGKEEVEGASCHKVKLTLKGGRVITYWIDASTHLIVQSASTGGFGGRRRNNEGAAPAEPQQVFTLFKDYKPVNGILFAHSIEMKNPSGEGRGGGGTTFDKIEINQPVDPKMYKPE